MRSLPHQAVSQSSLAVDPEAAVTVALDHVGLGAGLSHLSGLDPIGLVLPE